MREGILGALLQRQLRGGSSQAGSCGAGRPLHAQLLGGEGAHSEVFPGHQATRAPLGAVTPAQPPSCCQAPCPELVIAGARQHSPPACPCPLHCTLCTLQPPGAAPPCQGPCFSPLLLSPCFSPPACSFPPQLVSVSSWLCVHHTKCQTASTDTPQGLWARA